MNSDFLIRRENSDDYRKTEELVRDAFWNIYHPGCTEHYILHCFRSRKEFIPELDLVMEKDGRLIGQIMYVHSVILRDDGTEIPTMTFGPISIHPDYGRKGYGKQLLDFSVKAAADMGASALAITGNLQFYGHSGFVPGKTVGIRYQVDPEADYFLVRELREGYLKNVHGTFSDPDGYAVAEERPGEFEAYDRTFPVREKLKLPGQLE
ncbi:MAG: N-acetyltransferase [Eubacteriales bacterium]|jgi:predicted N-acetyltransferase YhbS